MSSFHMLVVGSAVEHHVTIGDRVSRVGVVVHGIGIQDVSAIVDLCLSAQLVHDAVLFLLQGTYGDVLLSHRGRRSGSEDCSPGCPEAKSNWLVTTDGASSR